MSDASEQWDVEALERALNDVLAGREGAATPEDNAAVLERIRRQLAWEWQQRLIVERNLNSEAAELTVEQRRTREAAIFDTALDDLLPLGAMLAEADERRGSATQARATSPADPIDAGLHALANGDPEASLRIWSTVGEVPAVAGAVRARREPYALQLLQQAAAGFAQAAALAGSAEATTSLPGPPERATGPAELPDRSELRTRLYSEYLEPARRVGTEPQRERALQLATALDLLLAPAPAAPPAQPRPAPAFAVAPRRAVAAAPLSPAQRRIPLLVTLCGLGILLLSLFGWTYLAAAPEARVPSAPTVVVSTPQIVAVVEDIAIPTATATEQPSATPSPEPSATAQPTATRAPQIAALEPAELFIGALPAELRISGAGLERVTTLQLLPSGGQPIALVTGEPDGDVLAARLESLPEAITGAVEARLVVDGVISEAPPIVLRDFKEIRTVAGVLDAYAYSGRILEDGGGSYTTIHEAADAASPPTAPLRNGEQVEVLADDVAGWYRVRIRVANDPQQIGKSGWVERWLVDDANAPVKPEPTPVPAPRPTATPRPTARPAATATPRPTVRPTARPTARPAPPPQRAFGAQVLSSFPGSGSSGRQSSCVQGVVVGRGGAGVGAAAIAVNNGSSEVGTLSNGAGEFRICGLGDSTWSVVLRFVPGEPPLAREAVATVYVNGSGEQVAVVNFVER